MSRIELKPKTILKFADGRNYEIRNLIGSGGSALLYEAKEIGSELYAVIKEIYPVEGYQRVNAEIVPLYSAAAEGLRYQARLAALTRRKEALRTQEVVFSQRASRKNYQVIPILSPVYEQADICLPDGTVFHSVKNSYARMDSLTEKGVTLGRYRKEHTLNQVFSIMHTILDAYAALHEDGFIHGDCQADNIFLLGTRAAQGAEYAGTAHIIDFGSARKLMDGTQTEVITDEIFSTDGYRAPELHMRGENFRMTPACDVWSLGFLMLNLLTGKAEELAELGEEGMTEFLLLHPREKLLSDHQAQRLGCDVMVLCGLNRILKKALANDPNDRFANAGAMREALLALDRCRRLDLSKGVMAEHLWEASIRYYEKNRQLFATEHQPGLTQELEVRRMTIYGEYEEPIGDGTAVKKPIGELLRSFAPENVPDEEEWPTWKDLLPGYEEDRETRGRNLYLYAPGGGGKSFAISEIFCEYLTNGKRIPLYLDMAGFTEKAVLEEEERAIARMIAGQYLDTESKEVCEEIEALLRGEAKGTPFFLALDNLHKVPERLYAKVLDAIKHADLDYPEVWMIVSGRGEHPQNPNSELERISFGQATWDWEIPSSYIRLFDSGNRIRIIPLTQDQILNTLHETLKRKLDPRESKKIELQMDTLKLPLFFMRYLEVLVSTGTYAAALDESREDEQSGLKTEVDEDDYKSFDEEDYEEDDDYEDYGDYEELPNSAAELLSVYFGEYEYGEGGRNLHQILEKYLPIIGYHYLISEQPEHTEQELEAWIREAYGSRRFLPWQFAEILDVCVRRLAILDFDGYDAYRFVHDCYMDYFASVWIAGRLQQALEEDDPRPLTQINHSWPVRIAPMWRGLIENTLDNGRLVPLWGSEELTEALYGFLDRHRDICMEQAYWLPRNAMLTIQSEYFQEEPRWIQLCAEFGNVEMASLLGFCYDTGFGTGEDKEMAAWWFRQARGQRMALCLPDDETKYEEEETGEVWYRPDSKRREYCEYSIMHCMLGEDMMWNYNWHSLLGMLRMYIYRTRRR